MERCPSKGFCMPRSKTVSIQPLLCCSYCSYCRPAKEKLLILHSNIFLPEPRLMHYTVYIAPGRVAIVTMASELSLLCRVDTTVRNKALLVPCGCQAFEQASAVLLAGCRRKKSMWRGGRRGTIAKSDMIQTGHIWFFNQRFAFGFSGPPLFSCLPCSVFPFVFSVPFHSLTQTFTSASYTIFAVSHICYVVDLSTFIPIYQRKFRWETSDVRTRSEEL